MFQFILMNSRGKLYNMGVLCIILYHFGTFQISVGWLITIFSASGFISTKVLEPVDIEVNPGPRPKYQ